MMIPQPTQRILANRAGWLAVAAGAAIPVSVAATSGLISAAVLLGLISGLYARHWRELLTHPVVLAAVVLFAWLALSLVYTEAPMNEGLRLLKKYRELLLIPLLMPLLLETGIRRWALRAFIAAMLLTLALSYVDATRQLLETGALQQDPVVFKHRITQNTLLAFTAYWVWLQAERHPGRRLLWLVLIGLIAFNVFVMVSGRSGQVIFLALATLALFRRYHWKGLLLTALLSLVLLGTAFLASDLFRGRLVESMGGLRNYQDMAFTNSTAIRISYYPNSLELIGQRPLLGHGVGSIDKVYREHVADTPFPPTVNPHNEFLSVGIQAGIPAMLMLAWLFYSQWRRGREMPREQEELMLGLLVTMVVGCLLNSFLMDSTEGHWYAFFTALLMSGSRDKGQGSRNI